jgi:predicted esterase
MGAKEYFSSFLRRESVYHDLPYGEKKIKRAMDEPYLKLRWHIRDKMVCVIHGRGNDAKVIFALHPREYTPEHVVHKLRQREKARKKMLQEYLAEQDRMKSDQSKKIKEVSSTMANGIEDLTKHRVSVTV